MDLRTKVGNQRIGKNEIPSNPLKMAGSGQAVDITALRHKRRGLESHHRRSTTPRKPVVSKTPY